MKRRGFARPTDEDGNAIIEFVFVAVVVLIPLVYLLAAVVTIQRSQLAVTQAAREVGRAFATSASEHEAQARVEAALRIALKTHNVPQDVDVRFVAAGASCQSSAVTPTLVAGAQVTVCVTRHVRAPGVPSVVAGRGVTCVGRYTVHVDDYRTVSP